MQSSQTVALIIIISIEIHGRTTNQLCHFDNKLHRPMQSVYCVAAVAAAVGSHLLYARSRVYMYVEM